MTLQVFNSSRLIRLLAEPESINTSFLIPPIFTVTTGSLAFDRAHVWPSTVKANELSSLDCVTSSTRLASLDHGDEQEAVSKALSGQNAA